MDIIKALAGGSTTDEGVVAQSSAELPIDLDETNLVKGLKGSFSETKTSKSEHLPKTTKNMFKQVNNTLNKIFNIVTNNSTPANKELYEKVSELSKEVTINKITVTELKENIVKTPQEKLREEDDNKELANQVISESVSKVIEESETITSIEDKLVDLETKVKLFGNENKSSQGVFGGLFSILKNIDGPVGKIAIAVSEVLDLSKSFPKLIKGAYNLIKKGGKLTAKLLKPLGPVINKIIPDSVKNIFLKEGAETLFSSVKNLFTKGGASTFIKELAPDLTKKLTSEGAETLGKKALKEGAESLGKTVLKEGAETLVEKGAAKATAKIAGKTGLKSLVKKIPVIGALMGAGFATPRLLKGDYAGAALEVASGISSTLPGVGTAASLGIDAALFARDLNQKTDVSTVDLDINKDKTKKIIESTKPVNILNENNVINNNTSNVRNISIDETEKDFILASKLG